LRDKNVGAAEQAPKAKPLPSILSRYRRLWIELIRVTEIGLCDRALVGTLAYTFARIGAVVNLNVEDYFQTESDQ
jgi:hypothetical protein